MSTTQGSGGNLIKYPQGETQVTSSEMSLRGLGEAEDQQGQVSRYIFKEPSDSGRGSAQSGAMRPLLGYSVEGSGIVAPAELNKIHGTGILVGQTG